MLTAQEVWKITFWNLVIVMVQQQKKEKII